MTDTTLRFYKYTIQTASNRERRIDEMKKVFRTRISRRRIRQQIHTTIQRLNFHSN